MTNTVELNRQSPLHVAVLVGSVRQGRFAPVIVRWFLTHARLRTDMTFDVIDLAELRLPDAYSQPPDASVLAAGARLAAAHAFVVITPEYNHSFPAPLKNLIDWFQDEWQKKPVGFVSYGGISGGLRAVEQLRQIFAELQGMTVRDSVSFHRAHAAFDSAGNLIEASGAQRTVALMLDQLSWWGNLLREARDRDQMQQLSQPA